MIRLFLLIGSAAKTPKSWIFERRRTIFGSFGGFGIFTPCSQRGQLSGTCASKSAIIRPPRMVFTSLTFIVVYVIVFALYWPLGKVGQNRLIVLSGLVFYGSWDWRFAVLLLCTTGVDFGVGLVLEKEEDERKRRAWLLLSLVTNLGALAFFKYFNFFSDSFARFSALFGLHPSTVTLNVVLPMGISFYTFQALSYTID